MVYCLVSTVARPLFFVECVSTYTYSLSFLPSSPFEIFSHTLYLCVSPTPSYHLLVESQYFPALLLARARWQRLVCNQTPHRSLYTTLLHKSFFQKRPGRDVFWILYPLSHARSFVLFLNLSSPKFCCALSKHRSSLSLSSCNLPSPSLSLHFPHHALPPASPISACPRSSCFAAACSHMYTNVCTATGDLCVQTNVHGGMFTGIHAQNELHGVSGSSNRVCFI